MLSADLIMSWFSTEFESMSMWEKAMFLCSHVMRLLMGFKEYHSEGMIPLKDSHKWTQELDGNTNDSTGDGETTAIPAAEITDEQFSLLHSRGSNT